MLDDLPYEVLENIAFWLANQYHDGHYYSSSSSSALLALFLTNKAIHDILLGAPTRGLPPNHSLLARLYDMHFNKQAFERRYRIKLTSDDLASQYKKHLIMLRRINRVSTSHSLDVYDQNPETIMVDLCTVLLMIYEDDGRNMRQLLHAGVERWVKSIILSPTSEPYLHLDENMWPLETDIVRISFAILSLVNTIESVTSEESEVSEGLLKAFQFFVVAPHKYPMFHYPITHFSPGENYGSPLPLNDTLPTMGPTAYSAPSDVEHFGRILRLTSPRVTESALCAMNLRLERVEMGMLPNTPANRAEADAMGRQGPTMEDHRENIYHRELALGSEVPHAGSERERANLACLQNPLRGSKRFDVDFWRVCSADWVFTRAPRMPFFWFSTVYTVGLVTGKWIGRLQMPFFQDFLDMVREHPMAPSWVDLVAQPMQLYLREYVVTNPVDKISPGLRASGDGVLNGWFPDGVDPSQGDHARQTSTTLEMLDTREPVDAWARKVYRLVDAGVQLPEGEMPPPPPKVGEEQMEQSSTLQSHFPEEVEMDIEEENMRYIGPHPDAPDQMLVEYENSNDYPPWIDVCITGETGLNYSLAYGGYKVYGRVRRSDGLIVLVRVTMNPQSGQGRWIFSGYLRASTTIVGQWRETGRGVNGIGYAGTFMMTKVGDQWGPPPLSSAGPSAVTLGP